MKSGTRPARGARPLVRPLVHQLHAYVPGEQPKIRNLIKLNTNENPYPPSPRVLSAIRAAVDGRLRLYPNPTAQPLRRARLSSQRFLRPAITGRMLLPSKPGRMAVGSRD